MIIALNLTHNGEYKFILDNMLHYCLEKKIRVPSYIGFDLIDFNTEPRQPALDSFIIYGPTGTDANPREIKPDKIVLRRVINHNELLLIINTRSSGWHRYNGSGSIVYLKYGNKTLLSDRLNDKNHEWLPKGKAGHRDKKITNRELNIYQPRSDGIEKLFYYLFSFDDTLRYKNYSNFIDSITATATDIAIKLDNANTLVITQKNNNLKISYNKADKIFDYQLN